MLCTLHGPGAPIWPTPRTRRVRTEPPSLPDPAAEKAKAEAEKSMGERARRYQAASDLRVGSPQSTIDFNIDQAFQRLEQRVMATLKARHVERMQVHHGYPQAQAAARRQRVINRAGNRLIGITGSGAAEAEALVENPRSTGEGNVPSHDAAASRSSIK